MTNTEGVVTKLLLHSKNSEQALLAYSRLRERYFSPTFASLYNHITSFYDEMGMLPSLNDLKLYRSRDARTASALASINLVDIENLDLDVAVDALINDYSQEVTLDLISDILENITLMDKDELIDKLAMLPIKFEEEIASPEQVLTADSLSFFKTEEDLTYNEVMLGISNRWDSTVAHRRQELALYGGARGSGKSLLCANICANQMAFGNVGVYFTIEMTGDETFQRIMSISCDVEFTKIRNNNLSVTDKEKIGKWLSDQYVDATPIFDKHFSNNPAPDVFKFEQELKSTCKLKEEGRLVIVDDRNLTLASIDVQLSKLKAQYGDKLEVVVVDYVNQIVWDGHESDGYDWKVQTVIGKQLKNLARKHDILIVSPYQIDSSGEARFSKGILDACDTAQLIIPSKEDNAIVLKPSKVRSGDDQIACTIGMNWSTLKTDPKEVVLSQDDDDDSPDTDFPTQAADL